MDVLTALGAQLDLWLDRFEVFFATKPEDVQGCMAVLEEVRRKELNRVAGGSVVASHALDAKGDLRLAACRDTRSGKIIGCMRITPASAAKDEKESVAEDRLGITHVALILDDPDAPLGIELEEDRALHHRLARDEFCTITGRELEGLRFLLRRKDRRGRDLDNF